MSVYSSIESTSKLKDPSTSSFLHTVRNRYGDELAHQLSWARASFRKSDHLLTWISAWLRFKPRADDIYIATYPRSGTTLMQMILYQLASDGDLTFNHISEKIPYFERSLSRIESLNRLPSPRVFKTHLGYEAIKWWPGKYIYVERSVSDVLISYYQFYRSHQGFTGSLDRFFDRFVQGKVQYGSWFSHVGEWRKASSSRHVLYLTYEDLLQKRRHSISEIAAFCNFACGEDVLDRAVERSHFDYMKRYEDKFDFYTEFLLETNMRPGAFVRRGEIGEGSVQLSTTQLEALSYMLSKSMGCR